VPGNRHFAFGRERAAKLRRRGLASTGVPIRALQ